MSIEKELQGAGDREKGPSVVELAILLLQLASLAFLTDALSALDEQ